MSSPRSSNDEEVGVIPTTESVSSGPNTSAAFSDSPSVDDDQPASSSDLREEREATRKEVLTALRRASVNSDDTMSDEKEAEKKRASGLMFFAPLCDDKSLKKSAQIGAVSAVGATEDRAAEKGKLTAVNRANDAEQQLDTPTRLSDAAPSKGAVNLKEKERSPFDYEMKHKELSLAARSNSETTDGTPGPPRLTSQRRLSQTSVGAQAVGGEHSSALDENHPQDAQTRTPLLEVEARVVQEEPVVMATQVPEGQDEELKRVIAAETHDRSMAKRRLLLGAGLLALIIIVVGIVVAIFVGGDSAPAPSTPPPSSAPTHSPSDSPTDSPTQAPTYSLSNLSFLNNATLENILNLSDSPEAMAWIWLQSHPRFSGEGSMPSWKKQQLFALATLYYATGGDKSWPAVMAHGMNAIEDGDDWDECRLFTNATGNCTSDGRLELLNLSQGGLVGTLPPQMGLLTDLTVLDLSNNRLEGALPTQLGQLSVLTVLDISENFFSGNLPSQVGQLGALFSMDMHENSFSGLLPPHVRLLTNLEYLSLSKNSFSGPVPSELGEMTKLTNLQADTNGFSGQLPVQLGNMNLANLTIFDSNLSGPIPTELGRLTSLQYLALFGNELTGALPSQLGLLTDTYYFGLSWNKMAGVLPTELGQLAELKNLGLGGNQFTGPIPSELGQLTVLLRLALGENALTGTLPEEMMNMGWVLLLELQHNQLTGTIPDWLPSMKILANVHLYDNLFYGEIPPEICGMNRLQTVQVDCATVNCTCAQCECKDGEEPPPRTYFP